MKQVLILVFLFPLILSSQSLSLGEISNTSVSYSLLDEDSGKYYIFFADSLSVVDLEQWKEVNRLALPYPTPTFKSEYQPVVKDDGLWFVHRKGGLVYQLMDGSFVRKDNSFDHRMQVNSAIFVHRDTIFRYGGYGFWTYRNFFTYFDPGLEEWMAVAPKNSEIFPRGTENAVILPRDGEFYVIGGTSATPQNFENRYFVNEVWKYDMGDKSWSFKGNVPGILMDKNLNFALGDRMVFSDQISPYLWVVDVPGNRFSIYKKNPTFLPLAKRSTIAPVVLKENIYALVWGPNDGSRLELVRLKENMVLGELVEKTPLLRDYRPYYWALGGILLFSAIVYLGVRLKKRWVSENRVVYRKGVFYYRGKALDLTSKEAKVLHFLLTHQSEIVTRDILNITENRELHYAHNIKVKNHLIDQLNFKLKSVLGQEEDLITIEKSRADRRIKVYRLNREKFLKD